jgi:hypothetical protein
MSLPLVEKWRRFLYRNDVIFPWDRERAGEFRTRNPPLARWRSWPAGRGVSADPLICAIFTSTVHGRNSNAWEPLAVASQIAKPVLCFRAGYFSFLSSRSQNDLKLLNQQCNFACVDWQLLKFSIFKWKSRGLTVRFLIFSVGGGLGFLGQLKTCGMTLMSPFNSPTFSLSAQLHSGKYQYRPSPGVP